MIVTAHIDWVSGTKRDIVTGGLGMGGIKRYISGRLQSELGSLDWVSGKPVNGYTVAMESETGIKLMSNEDRPDMGLHIIISGSALSKCEKIGITTDSIMDWMLASGYRLSRLDIAVDAVDSGLLIQDLANDVASGKVNTRARTAPYIDDKMGEGKTQYIGSMRKRTKLFRAYSKDAEQGLIDTDWKRFELELRGKHAVNAGDIIMTGGAKEKTIQGLILGYVDFYNNPVWREIMGTDEIDLKSTTWETGDTQKWLLEQVAPSLARVLDDDESFMSRFMNVVGNNRVGLKD